MQPTAASVFDSPAPAFTDDEVARIAADAFGISGPLRTLHSERDQNVHVGAHVVKIANAAEDRPALELHHAALAHLALTDPTLPLPRVVAPGIVEHGGHLVRAVSFLPGTPYATVPHTAALRAELGRFMGRVSKGLCGFGHPAAHRPHFLWNLDHAQAVRPWVADIVDPEDRAVVETAFRRHQQRVVPLLTHLRGAVVHHDANDYNVLVDHGSVSGLIDFGDMVFARQVNEVAVTLAYALLDTNDVVAAGRDVIAAYVGEFALTDDELRVVYDLAATRLAMSVAISSHRSHEFPDNEYLLISQAPALRLLRKLMSMRPEFLHFAAREAAGLTPVPRHDRIVGWLQSPDCRPASVLPLDLRRAGRVVVSLADGAPATRLAGPEESWEWMQAQMDAANAQVVVGRYDEDRSCYAGEQFRTDAPEPRSVHTGIDLFIAEDTPVHAMLPGTVESVVDNAVAYDYGPTVVLRHTTGDGTPFWVLYGHLSRATLTHVQPGQRVAAGDVVGFIGDHTVNGGWAPHVHVQIMTDLMADPDTGFDGNFEGAGEPSRMAIWKSLVPDANLLIRLAPETFADHTADEPQLLEQRRALSLSPSLSTSYRRHLSIVRGEGAWLYDHTGRGHLDCVNNVAHVGHCHPHVVDAIARQAAQLNTNTRYLHRTILEYAERLAATFPDPLRVVYFTNSGSEANELALRLARTVTGRHDIVAVDWGYHGNTNDLVEISAYKFNRKGGAGKPAHTHLAELPDPYRGTHGDDGPAYAASVAVAAEAARARNGGGPAAFIAESISGCGGQVVFPTGYLAAAARHARDAGALYIADEVQVGFGRVGSHMWAFELQGVVPDIVTLGKPIGNGHPLGAVVTTPAIAAAFANGMEWFNTFGGNPVSCAAGMAVLDVIEGEGLQAHASHVGAHLLQRFTALGERHEAIGDVRGEGLYLGLDLVVDRATKEPATALAAEVANRLRERGVLISTDGPFDNVIKIKPPLVLALAEADLLCDELDRALSS
ncbi:MAG: aminotransferase class III-fold pyridoxal phosphate-dependent enzyme [Actinomycetota bacterium]|nr:aminotransferase class III-fold pyridoxal phosphate-dependent enzyme [Actinomycetota bacterium]